MKRRLFLKAAASSSVLPISLNGMSLRTFGKESFFSVLGKRANVSDRVLVIIQMNGGNDGLNMVIPIDQYSNLSRARTNILIDQIEEVEKAKYPFDGHTSDDVSIRLRTL